MVVFIYFVVDVIVALVKRLLFTLLRPQFLQIAFQIVIGLLEFFFVADWRQVHISRFLGGDGDGFFGFWCTTSKFFLN